MNTKTLSFHILRALAEAQSEGRVSNLDTLAEAIRVRRRDLRSAVTALHKEGMLDAVYMRLTLRGFAIGRAAADVELPALRHTAVARRIAA